MPGIEPGASYMQSMRSTTELHPHLKDLDLNVCYDMIEELTSDSYSCLTNF